MITSSSPPEVTAMGCRHLFLGTPTWRIDKFSGQHGMWPLPFLLRSVLTSIEAFGDAG
jgi:hypothetical protein